MGSGRETPRHPGETGTITHGDWGYLKCRPQNTVPSRVGSNATPCRIWSPLDKVFPITCKIGPLLGVETDASEPLSLIPTPTGVACRPKDGMFFHRGQT